MPSDPSRFVPVNTTVLLQTLVEAVHEQVQERLAAQALTHPSPALQSTEHAFAGDNEPELDRDLRLAGYLARVVEVDIFEPARDVAAWALERLQRADATHATPDATVASLCAALARAEPIGKPSPDDPDAMSWQVPGPGGHVRHFVARRAIEELLRERPDPVAGDPADLKRPWLYGFFVRTCEEALAAAPPGPTAT
jgi:hypothetical protein